MLKFADIFFEKIESRKAEKTLLLSRLVVFVTAPF